MPRLGVVHGQFLNIEDEKITAVYAGLKGRPPRMVMDSWEERVVPRLGVAPR